MLSILVLPIAQVIKLFVFKLLILCVGYNAPIDFRPGALTHLLESVKCSVQKTLAIFSKQYILPSHVESETADDRKAIDESLISEILPQLDVHLMAVTPMERHYGDFCYINHSQALIPQVTGSLSPQTP